MSNSGTSLRSALSHSLLSLSLAGSLAACGQSANNGQGNDTDLSVNLARDMAVKVADMTPAPHDYAVVDMPTTPLSGSVGATGGSVSRLFFGFSGDARPSMCDEHTDYPSAILDSIFTRLNTAGVQFQMDLGDHMFVCQNGTQKEATAQMNLYMASAAKLNAVSFLTMGNHDCVSMTNPNYCGVNGFTTPNYVAFMSALASEKISNLPYYSFDVNTQAGMARFVVIADNAWSTDQQTWLQETLDEADADFRYIFIFRHHPLDNTDWPAFPTISQMIKNVKHRTLTFEGHTHEYRLDTYNDPTGRTLIIGNAGAPLSTNFTWYGYGTLEQLENGNLAIRLYDQSTGNQMSAFQVAPQ